MIYPSSFKILSQASHFGQKGRFAGKRTNKMARRSGGRTVRKTVSKGKPKKCEQSSKRMKTIAAKVLRDKRFSKKAHSLAASVLTQ